MTAVHATESQVVQRLVDAVSTAHLVRAAHELGLLHQLARRPRDANSLAHECATDPATTRELLDTLGVLGVVRRDVHGRYELAVDGLPLVAAVDRGWSQLAGVVRSGEPLAQADTADGAAALYPDIVPALATLVAPAARRAAQLLAGTGTDVLDVGAGAAPWSIALAGYSAAVRVTALDLPTVITATRRAVEAAGLGERFAYLPGDMFTRPLPRTAYDVVLVANVCHLLDAAQNRTLLRRLRPTLRPEGLLAIIDALSPAEHEPDASVSLYALGLRLRTSRGAVHPLEAYETWTSQGGFGPIQVEPLSATPPLWLLACRTR
ncbi:MAG TPA: class I SAM-dependent methyltransferase [Kribbellaceae bacterium]